ncbi:hypothetical protein V1511DRAFT_454930 [Dipodascopsis uninucleata]
MSGYSNGVTNQKHTRHRPPPIVSTLANTTDSNDYYRNLNGHSLSNGDNQVNVTFAPNTGTPNRSALLSGLRTSRSKDLPARSPYPPGLIPTPTKSTTTDKGYGNSMNKDINMSYVPKYVGYGDDISEEEQMDPKIYAALQAKQNELMATSMYIAQQQQRIQMAMISAANFQQQQQGPNTYNHYRQASPQPIQYYQDSEGNIWAMPTEPQQTLPAMQTHVTASASPRVASPVSNSWESDTLGYGTVFYSQGNNSASSLTSNNNKNNKRNSAYNTVYSGNNNSGTNGNSKPHKRNSSIPSFAGTGNTNTLNNRKSASPPVGPQFDEYRFDNAQLAKTAINKGPDIISTNQFAPSRQPLIPITLEELRKSANSDLNFKVVGVSRLTFDSRGGPIVNSSAIKVDDNELRALWSAAELKYRTNKETHSSVYDVQRKIGELSVRP